MKMTSIPAPESPPAEPAIGGRERHIRVLPGIERVEVSLHGHRVNFNIAGKGPPVVLIHGVAGRAAQWDQALRLLAETHTVVAPDLLGHGDSARPRGAYSLVARTLPASATLLVGLNVERASVVGRSGFW